MTLTKDTKVTVGAAGAVIVAICTGVFWLNAKLEGMNARIGRLEETRGEAYTLTAASEAALRMAIENPGMRVPDPRKPAEIIEVRDRR